MLKNEKVSKYFVQDCLKIFLSVFTSLKIHGNSYNEQLLVEKVKPVHEYWPAPIRKVFNIKVVLGTKVQNSAFRNISYFGLCHISVALNINSKSK